MSYQRQPQFYQPQQQRVNAYNPQISQKQSTPGQQYIRTDGSVDKGYNQQQFQPGSIQNLPGRQQYQGQPQLQQQQQQMRSVSQQAYQQQTPVQSQQVGNSNQMRHQRNNSLYTSQTPLSNNSFIQQQQKLPNQNQQLQQQQPHQQQQQQQQFNNNLAVSQNNTNHIQNNQTYSPYIKSPYQKQANKGINITQDNINVNQQQQQPQQQSQLQNQSQVMQQPQVQQIQQQQLQQQQKQNQSVSPQIIQNDPNHLQLPTQDQNIVKKAHQLPNFTSTPQNNKTISYQNNNVVSQEKYNNSQPQLQNQNQYQQQQQQQFNSPQVELSQTKNQQIPQQQQQQNSGNKDLLQSQQQFQKEKQILVSQNNLLQQQNQKLSQQVDNLKQIQTKYEQQIQQKDQEILNLKQQKENRLAEKDQRIEELEFLLTEVQKSVQRLTNQNDTKNQLIIKVNVLENRNKQLLLENMNLKNESNLELQQENQNQKQVQKQQQQLHSFNKTSDSKNNTNNNSPQKNKQVEQQQQQQQTIFQKIGGQESVNIAVDLFYDKVLKDSRISHYFKSTNMQTQRKQQKLFLTHAFGGPNNYKGQDMFTAHQHLNINNNDFDITGGILLGVLKDLGVEDINIKEIAQIWESQRQEVVNEKQKIQDSKNMQQKSPLRNKNTLLENIGGQNALNQAVDLFYNKVLQDQQLSPYFKNTNMEKQRQMQKHFLTQVFGGPQNYTGKDMFSAHQHLNISQKHFSYMGQMLIGVLQSLNVDQQSLYEISNIWDSLQNEVVNEKSKLKSSSKDNSDYKLTLYSRLGGETAINKAVDLFYDRLLADQKTKHYFKNTDMQKQRSQQKCFLSQVFGGPQNYKGKDMYSAHSFLNINEQDFIYTGQVLLGALKDLSVGEQEMEEVSQAWNSLKDDIITQQKQQPVQQTILDRIGGKKALYTAVDIFYDSVLRDERVKHYFKNTNMQHQRQQQKDFLETVLGGQENNVYKGRDMYNAHKHLYCDDKSFDVIVELLVQSLVKCGVDQNTIQEIGQIVEPLRNEVVTKKTEQTNQKKTILDKIGGLQNLSKAVDLFYDKMLQDVRVKHYFNNTNMVHQRQQQKDFLQTVLGNQTTDQVYKGKNMYDAHKHLKCDSLAYDATINNLVSALISCGVEENTLQEIGQLVESLRNDIVIVQQPQQQQQIQQQQQQQLQQSNINSGLKNNNNQNKSILDKIGGKLALGTAVDMFYDSVLRDDRIKHYFKNTDMQHQRQQQKDFLQQALGGEAVYKGRNMYDAHKHLQCDNKAFDAIVEVLLQTLVRCGVDQQILQEISVLVESLRGDIVTVNDNNQQQQYQQQNQNQQQQLTLLDKIGGKQALYRAVDIFYDSMLKDDRVKHYFKNTNMLHQRQQQKDFLQTVLGNQNSDSVYNGQDMYNAHKHLNCDDKAFDVTVELLVQSLIKIGVDQQTLNEIGGFIENLRNDIVIDQKAEHYPISYQKAQQQQSIFEQIGGQAGIKVVVEVFYERVLQEEKLKQFFKSTHMGQQGHQLELYLTQVLGGPQEYQGRSMFNAHKHLHIKDDEFNCMGGTLIGVLNDMQVESGLINQITQLWESLRKDVVDQNRKSQQQLQQQQQLKENMSILQKIGGEQKLYRVVDLFYDKVLADPRVNYFFKNTNMSIQRQMQKHFLQLAFGGQNLYLGKDMHSAHKHLGISDRSYDDMVDLLLKTLIECQVDKETLKQIKQIVESLRRDIVTTQKQDEISLFQKIGGEPGINIAVDKFFTNIKQNTYFANIIPQNEIEQLKQCQKQFLIQAMGGPYTITPQQMQQSYKNINLTEQQFGELSKYLIQVFKDFGLQNDIQQQIEVIWNTEKIYWVQNFPNLLTRIGLKKIEGAVDIFYDRCLANPLINKFFNTFDTSQLRQQQKKYLTTVFGGPNNYMGKDIESAHKHLKITDKDFEVMANIFSQTLTDLSINQYDIKEAMLIWNSLKSVCVI